MMQSELFQPSCALMHSSSFAQFEFYGLNFDAHMDACDFSSSFNSPEDISDTFSIPSLSTVFPLEFSHSPAGDDNMTLEFPADNFLLEMEEFEPHCNSEMENLISESERNFASVEMSSEAENPWSPSPSIKSMEISSVLTLHYEDMQIDHQLCLLHLLKAYGEAVEKGQRELQDVIMRCVSEKVGPAGEILERLAFYLSQGVEKQGYYLRQESSKNFKAAFRAFYQIFPHGRFAQVAANSAILEAMPSDADTIHIVDFDIGEGIQWPPMMEALAQKHKSLRLTAIKWEKEDSDAVPLMWAFEQTKRRLVDHAKCFHLQIRIEEMEIAELVNEIKKTNKRGGKKEWLAFNCMVGLPHMGRIRRRKSVDEFLRVAKELMDNSVYCKASKRGIVTIGDGDSWENLTVSSGFGSFFNGNLAHYQALLESVESNLPTHLAEARIALECLFVGPYVSSTAWLQRWMETSEIKTVQIETWSEEWRISKESLEEAREMVEEKQSFYEVKWEGNSGNRMTLEWKGIPLVKVSAWRP